MLYPLCRRFVLRRAAYAGYPIFAAYAKRLPGGGRGGVRGRASLHLLDVEVPDRVLLARSPGLAPGVGMDEAGRVG